MRILVVEDDPTTAQALAQILSVHNHVVETASDGRTGWDLVESFDYDLLLLDVMLPELDGIEFCRRVRSHGYQMPILLLTARDSGHDKALGLDAGADDYVVKPFDPEELVARVRALLRRGGAIAAPVLEWGSLQLDPTSCEAQYDGSPLTLTPKEYALLELFLRNTRRVFSCGMILEHLWVYDEAPGEDAVRTHIKGLRQKLKAAGAPADLIETVYGIGYRLKPLAAPAPDTNAKSPQPSEATREKTVSALAKVWERSQPQIRQQIEVLVQTARACSQNVLTPHLQQQARQVAHSLAGALGTFGFPKGSEHARQIEQILQTEPPRRAAVATLNQLISDLSEEVTQSPCLIVAEPIADHTPLVLIVDCDRAITDELVREAAAFGLQTAIAPTLAQARQALARSQPSVVLLDPTIATHREESLRLLADLAQHQPPIPVLVYAAQPSLTDRLEIAQQGRHTFLQKPSPPSEVLETISHLIHRIDTTAPRLLVVDDDPHILEALRTLLYPWGLQVTTLEDPRRFWETLEASTPDLLILDVEMPHLNGIELCQIVRNDSRWGSLPILFLTVHSEPEILNQIFTAGADDFISKPIVAPELVARIINRLERLTLLRERAQATRQTKAMEAIYKKTEAALRKSKAETELRVAERTAELVSINQRLQTELEERSHVEQELRISQARFAGILEIADDAIISVDSNQRITLFNQGAEKIFGYAAHEVLGQPLDVLLPLRSTESHRHHVRDFGTSNGQARRMGDRKPIFGRRRDGSEFPAEASISKLSLGNETVFTVILRDITERRQSEETLERLSRQNELILNSIGEGLCGLDMEGTITVANPATLKLLGTSFHQLLGQPFARLLLGTQPDGSPYPFSASPIYSSLQDGAIRQVSGEYFQRPDGTSFPVEYVSTPIRENGAIVGAVVTFKDITERQQVERMKDEFISVVSHELRTPLTSIHGSLKLLTSGLLDAHSERGQRLLQIAVDSTDRLVRLINDILDIERIESGKVMMAKQACNVAELLAEAANVMQAIAHKANITLSVASLDSPLWADPDRIIQTLTNLLSNAIKFSAKGNTVWLGAALMSDPATRPPALATTHFPLSLETPSICFYVRDQGRGIPADKLTTIFERFQQVDASDSRNSEGTGLGLAICRSIVQEHGGHIWVDSALGKGSTFYFTLPLRDPSGPSAKVPSSIKDSV